MGRIDQRSLENLSHDPREARYWDRRAIEAETERVFEICDGCRLCFNLCPSFPLLFEAMDRADHRIAGVSSEDRQRVVDLCFGCRICDVKCPYTPSDGHAFALDFPALILRIRAANARRRGIPLRDRILSNPDALGAVASLAPGLVNWANRATLPRRLMEGTLGIHRDKRLPDYATETFEDWARNGNLPPDPPEPNARVVLFSTCFVNHNRPGPGKAAVEVLARNGVAIRCPELSCCGMPALDVGDLDFARKQAQSNVDALLPHVREGYLVVAINPTCTLMMREEYPRILGSPEAAEVASAVRDTPAVLFDLKRRKLFDRSFCSTPGSIAYHVPCHLRALSMGFRGRDLMRLIPGVKISFVEECCGHDGTWAMKKENFPASMKVGTKAFNGIRSAEAQVVSTDCPLAAIQLGQALGVEALHPLEVLARAYRPDGFPTPLASPGAPSSGDPSR